MQAGITSAPFGPLPDGRSATEYTLINRHGLQARITDYGGIITQLHTPDRRGDLADIVLGYEHVAQYVDDDNYFGALIGRYGNRIRHGMFEVDGRRWQLPVNNGGHHLHGGPAGFNKVLWRTLPFHEGESVGLTLLHTSPNGAQGYPGNLDVTVVYELTGDNQLMITFDAVTDRPTPINLTQHSYFNLAGGGDILGHQLTLDADRYTPVDATLIPDGRLADVAGTPFDFRQPHAIGDAIGADHPQLRHAHGYDHNFVLNQGGPRLRRAARVTEPHSGRVLELFTEEPGVQFYSGNFLDGSAHGKGRRYGYRSGFCLEPQHFPDSPNQTAFPNTILRPGQEYTTVSAYKFSVER